jgi:hypothetical protein
VIAAWAGVAQAVIALATLVVTVAVTVLVYVGTRAIARIEHDRGVREAWNAINAIAVSDPDLLEVAETLMPEPATGPRTAAEARRKWFAYMFLNVLSSTYSGAHRRFTRSRPEALATCAYHIGLLVRHDDVYALTQEGYSRAFAAFCKEIRRKQAVEATAPPQSSTTPTTNA